MRILLLPDRLIHVVQYPFGGLERFLDRLRLRLVVRVDAHGEIVQVVEQQRVLGQSLQYRRQQILQLQPPAGLVRLGLHQQPVQGFVLFPALLQRLKRDLLAGTKVGRVLLQVVTGLAVELKARSGYSQPTVNLRTPKKTHHQRQQVADFAHHVAVLGPPRLQRALKGSVQFLEAAQRRRKEQNQKFRGQGARFLHGPHEDALQQPERSHVVALGLVDFCEEKRIDHLISEVS